MKVSKKAYYGLRAVLTLAQTEKPLSIHTLAETEHLPEEYLEKILQQLRRAGLVEAKKGTSGGYSLVRKAKDLNVWEILQELDGPIKTFMPPVKGELPCLQVSHCQSNQVWRTLETEIKKTLTDLTLDKVLTSNQKK